MPERHTFVYAQGNALTLIHIFFRCLLDGNKIRLLVLFADYSKVAKQSRSGFFLAVITLLQSRVLFRGNYAANDSCLTYP